MVERHAKLKCKVKMSCCRLFHLIQGLQVLQAQKVPQGTEIEKSKFEALICDHIDAIAGGLLINLLAFCQA